MEVVHLNQKQLAARWHLSEACLERWRSEGTGPKLMKLKGRVLTAVGALVPLDVEPVVPADTFLDQFFRFLVFIPAGPGLLNFGQCKMGG